MNNNFEECVNYYLKQSVNYFVSESKEMLDRIDNGSPQKIENGVSNRRLSIVLYFDTSSYIAVPARATLISAVVLVPYLSLVPAVCMDFRNSFHNKLSKSLPGDYQN